MPLLWKKGITFRKLVSKHAVEKHAVEAESSQVIGIECLAPGCGYLCRSGVVCFTRHVKAYHSGRNDTPYLAVAIDIPEDLEEDKHTGHCIFLSKLYEDKLNKNKEQFRIARMLYKEMKAKHTEELKSRKNGKKFKLEVRLVKKAMARNYRVNKNSIFVQDRSRRTKFD